MIDYKAIERYADGECVVTTHVLQEPSTGRWAAFFVVLDQPLIAFPETFDTQAEAQAKVRQIMDDANDLLHRKGVNALLYTDE